MSEQKKPELWTDAEAAAFLGVPVDTVGVVAGDVAGAVVDGLWVAHVLRNWAKGIGAIAAKFSDDVAVSVKGPSGRTVGFRGRP